MSVVSRRGRRGLGAGSAKRIASAAIEALEPRIQLSGALYTDAFSYPLGGFNNAGLKLNGGASISTQSYAQQLQLSDGVSGEARSAFTTNPYNVSSFSTTFNVQFSGPSTAGLAFVMQTNGDSALGGGQTADAGIPNSVAVEFQATASGTFTDLKVNGVSTTPAPISPSSIDLSDGDVLLVNIQYDGATLVVTETDTQNSLAPVTSSQTYNLTLPAHFGGQAYVGFTGADGISGITQVIQSWEFADIAPTDTDIGSPIGQGSSAFTAGGNYLMQGAGTGIGSTSDQFHFTSQAINGDSTMLAQYDPPIPGPGSGTVAGLMLRNDLTPTSAFAELAFSANGAQFLSRTTDSAPSTASAFVPSSPGDLMKLVRNGPTVSGYISADSGTTWQLVGTAEIPGPAASNMGLAIASGDSSAVAGAFFSQVDVSATPSLGLDTGTVTTFPEQQPIWVDIMKQSGGFFQAANTSIAATLDANGWPTQDFSIPSLIAPTPLSAGVYSLSMTDSQDPTVVFAGGAHQSNINYNASTGVYTANVSIPGGGNISMTVTNTGNGAQNIRIIRPGYDPTNPPVFTTSYISFLQSLHPTVLRFMNWTQTNNNPVSTWAERTLPSDPTQNETLPLLNFDGSVSSTAAQKGVAWEYAIMLANDVHADMWINIPGQATDDYIQQLANLIKNGDTVDGVTYPGLDPDLNVYIEFSNETWNTGNNVYAWSQAAAVAEVVSDAAQGIQSNLNYDNLSLAQNSDGSYKNAPTWQRRWTARRLLQISNIFATVFGQADINTRIRPVLANLPVPSVQASQLAYINAVFGAPDKYFYSVSTATYTNMNGPLNTTNTLNGGNLNPNLSVNDVLNNLSVNSYGLISLYDSLDAVAQQYGLQMDAYESGPDLSGFLDTAPGGTKNQAELDARYTTWLEQYYEAWFAHGGGTAIYFTGGVRSWGQKFGDFQIAESQSDLFDAKEIGFRDAVSATRASVAPVVVAGLSIPAVSSSRVILQWNDSTEGSTEYRMEASTDPTFNTNLVTEIAPMDSSIATFTGLAPGTKYYFRVVAASDAGDAEPSNVATATTPGKAAIPAAPANVTATAVSNSTATVNWSDSSLTESGFTILVATDPAFSNIIQTLTAPADAASITVLDLNASTTYYFSVTASNSAGSSLAVPAPSFTTPAAVPAAQYLFDEFAGNTAVDSGSSPEANGSLVGGVTRVAGPGEDGAVNFDGSTGYVDLGAPAKFNFQGQITVSAWIKPTSVTGQEDIVAKDWDGLDTPFFLDLTSPTTVSFGTFRFTGFGVPNIQATGTSTTPLTDGNWHFVAGVYDGKQFKVYIDGVLAGTLADPYGVTTGSANTNIGRNANGGGGSHDYFDGSIADVEIYTSGLSDSDIANLAASAGQPIAPIAVGDGYTTLENVPLAVSAPQGVLTNDVAQQGDPINAVLITAPAQGTLTLNSDGSFNYIPANDFNGTASFTYADFDGTLTSQPATVLISITPVNQAPVITAANPPAVAENSGTQTLTKFAAFNPGAANESSQSVLGYSVTNVSNPSLFATLPSVATNGTLTYKPAANASGSSTFTLTVQDNGGTANGGQDTSAPLTFTITVNQLAVPTAPANFVASGISTNQLTLSWTESSPTTGFILRQSFDGVNWATIANPTAGATNANVTGLSAGTNYYFQIAAANVTGPSAFTTIGPIATPSAAPLTIIQTIDDSHVTFTGRWWYGTYLAGYYGKEFVNDGNQAKGTKTVQFNVAVPTAGNFDVSVWYPADPGNAASVPVSIVTATGTINVLVNEQTNGGQWLDLGTYAFNAGAAQIIFSNTNTTGLVVANAVRLIATGVATPALPAAPTSFAASGITNSGLSLAWSETSPVSGYVLQQSTDGSNWITIATPSAAATSAPVTGLNPGSNYYFQIQAVNAVGPSAFTTIGPIATAATPVVSVIQTIDDAGVTFTGRWWFGTYLPGYYGKEFVNDGNQLKGTKSVNFNLTLPTAGNYDISVWYPADPGNSAAVPVSILTAGGTQTVLVNEQTNGGQWLDLGTYAFAAGTAQIIFSNTNTTGLVVANAVRMIQVV